MQQSNDRILTTHMGSLPRGDVLANLLIARDAGEAIDQAALDAAVDTALQRVVDKQVECGIDIGNDGEQPRVSFQTYVTSRMSGFGGEGERPLPLEMKLYPQWAALMTSRRVRRARVYNAPAAIGAVAYDDLSGVASECDAFRRYLAGRDDAFVECFMTAASPGIVTTTLMNHHYDSHEAYLFAVAGELKKEYTYIVDAGFLLQIDAPDLAMERASFFQDNSLREFQDNVALHVEAINVALDGIPADKVRLHACWGNRDGPHTQDVALADVLTQLLDAKVGALCLPFANSRHSHEIDLLRNVRLPDSMLLVPGVIESTHHYVEHPEVIAERIIRAVGALGARERVVAGVDCGFGTFAGDALVSEDVMWEKFRALRDGAALASKRLWG